MTSTRDDAQGHGGPVSDKSDAGGTASVLKALQLLDVFRDTVEPLGVSELARRVGVPTSTAYRLLAYLVQGGLVDKVGTQYRPGHKLFELGSKAASSRLDGLRDHAAPYLGELHATTGMTARLGVLQGDQIVLLDKVVGLRTPPGSTLVGGRLPATCTALGKAILAFQTDDAVRSILQRPLARRTRFSIVMPGVLHRQLLDVRTSRLAHDREESIIGHACIATPVFRHGQPVAALSLSSTPGKMDPRRFGPALISAARQLERTLGRVAGPVGARFAPSGKRPLQAA